MSPPRYLPPGCRPLRGAPGIYVGPGGQMHVAVEELLKANGIEPTAANVAALERKAAAMVAQHGIPTVVVEHDEDPDA